ncbi:FRG domain-containing protein [Bordetella bronchiseptica]|uniref:FRG domain-containing protein n=1 Tax=Bordetella bronchiseptica TaxID=518 RepID=UPI000528BA45|nr:FRG domain-containing protein [Bordetella bronchiseptica]
MGGTKSYRELQHLGQVDSVGKFLDVINKKLDGSARSLFRGHRREDWPLKPSIARQSIASKSDEAKMLDEFVRRAAPYTESTRAFSQTDWLAVAQHHGMPTRLLDWTGSALAALWFAVEKPADGNTAGAVWMLPYAVNDVLPAGANGEAPFELSRTVLIRPRHVTQRITAQDGWFTLHRRHSPSRTKASGPVFIGLETNVEFRERLNFVTIPPAAFGQIRVELATAGVTAAVIYPDLGGIARYVTWAHLHAANELNYRAGDL